MSRFNQISIDQVIARTKMQLRLVNTTEHDDFFEVVIEEALRKLSPLGMYIKKQCTLQLTDRKAKLPKGFYKLIAVRYNDSSVTSNSNVCNYAIYADKKFLSDCNCEGNFGVDLLDYSMGFQIVGNYIHWNTSISDTSIELAYMAVNTDDNGRTIVYEDYESALSAYACKMYAMSWPDKYPNSLVDRYNSIWVNQRAKIRGEDAAYNFRLEKREIQNIFNALAVSRNVNF